MSSFIMKLGLGAVMITGGLGYSAYDKTNNYDVAAVEIKKVETLCYGKKTSRGIATKTTSTTKEIDCKTLRGIVENHPDYSGYNVHQNTYVSYRFKSPVDGKFHNGRHVQAKNDKGKSIKRRDVIKIRVSKNKADKTRKF